MFEMAVIESLIRDYGLLIVAPIAIVEGPIVSVIAGHLAALGYFDLVLLTTVLVLADLVGDFAFYALGSFGRGKLPNRWMTRVGVSAGALDALTQQYRRRGGKLLVIGKITHGAGAAVLFAAGAARMPFGAFCFYNTLATIPKSLFFVFVGVAFGHAYTRVDGLITTAGSVILALIVVAGALWLWMTRAKSR